MYVHHLGEVDIFHTWAKKIHPLYNSAKIIKIDRDFPKLWSQMYCHLFYGSQCRVSQRLHTSAKENVVSGSRGSGLLPKFNWDCLVERYICDEILTPSKDISRTVEKCPISQCWRILLKIPGSGTAGRWVPKFNQFFLVHRYICDKIFVKIHWVVFM